MRRAPGSGATRRRARIEAIGYRAEAGAVVFSYAIDGTPAAQRIALQRTACNCGGTQPWFICPVRGERVAVLYLRAGRFACRHCQCLAYASRSGEDEQPVDLWTGPPARTSLPSAGCAKPCRAPINPW